MIERKNEQLAYISCIYTRIYGHARKKCPFPAQLSMNLFFLSESLFGLVFLYF